MAVFACFKDSVFVVVLNYSSIRRKYRENLGGFVSCFGMIFFKMAVTLLHFCSHISRSNTMFEGIRCFRSVRLTRNIISNMKFVT